MLNICDFIQVYVYTTNHHLKLVPIMYPCKSGEIPPIGQEISWVQEVRHRRRRDPH